MKHMVAPTALRLRTCPSTRYTRMLSRCPSFLLDLDRFRVLTCMCPGIPSGSPLTRYQCTVNSTVQDFIECVLCAEGQPVNNTHTRQTRQVTHQIPSPHLGTDTDTQTHTPNCLTQTSHTCHARTPALSKSAQTCMHTLLLRVLCMPRITIKLCMQ